CAHMARSQRARKRVMPSLIAVPLPAGLTGAFGGGGAAGLITSKVAALAVSAALVGAGALVETKVIHVPGSKDERKAPALEAALNDVGASASPEIRSALDFQRPKRTGLRGLLAKEKAGAKAKKKGGKGDGTAEGGKQSAAGSQGQGGSGGSVGSVGSGQTASGGSGGVQNALVTPPPAPTLPDVVGTVGGVVGGAQDKLPPLPVSPPIEPPSLPPVQIPGTGSLP
ncbi:MAG: hypothetical protein H0U90_11205, partial [Actinobacteria bacterium]|nr:hypothetical protein [Actinomycetota bacterium]